MNRSDKPRARCRRSNSATTPSATSGSSADVASSSSSMAGLAASARAMATRCACPPESEDGLRPAKSRGSPTSSRRSAARSARYSCGTSHFTGSRMISATLQRGSRLAKGSWNTGWIRRRCSELRRLRGGMAVPCQRTEPAAIGPNPAIARPNVDLPEPEPPTSASVSPSATLRLASTTASMRPLRQPGLGKCT